MSLSELFKPWLGSCGACAAPWPNVALVLQYLQALRVSLTLSLKKITKDENNPDPCPTEEEVATLAEELRVKDEYRLPRQKEYPNIKDQLDMIYHDQVNGTNTFKDAIEAVKTKYPKS